MTAYKKVPQCRICRSSVGAQIDLALIKGTLYKEIEDTFNPAFPEDGKLNRFIIGNHWKHMREAAEYAAANAFVQKQLKPDMPSALAPHREDHPPERQQVFQALVHERINEIEVLEKLVKSGLNDLERLSPQDNETEFAVLNRDRVRSNTARITVDSAKVKQIAAQVNEDQQRLEKSRLVFRMFELFGKALQACPADFRGLIGSELKDLIRRDDELNQLMRAQSAAPKEPMQSAEVIEPTS